MKEEVEIMEMEEQKKEEEEIMKDETEEEMTQAEV